MVARLGHLYKGQTMVNEIQASCLHWMTNNQIMTMWDTVKLETVPLAAWHCGTFISQDEHEKEASIACGLVGLEHTLKWLASHPPAAHCKQPSPWPASHGKSDMSVSQDQLQSIRIAISIGPAEAEE